MRTRRLINQYLLANSSYRVEKLPRRAKAYASRSIDREDFYPALVAQVQDLKQAFHFIVVGANDGVRQDPLYPVLRPDRARGVVVEPQPPLFERLCASYEGFPGVTCLNVAVHPTRGSAPLFYIDAQRSSEPVPDYVNGIASFDRSVLEKHRREIPDFEQLISERIVSCVRMDALLEQLGAAPDVVQIDTEGFDYEILKMIPFDQLRPRILHFETKHLGDADFTACVEMLVDCGYEFVFDRFDATAILRPD